MKESKESKPVSRLYIITKYAKVQLFNDGWRCTCGAAGWECEHVKAAKKMYEAEQK